MGEYKPIGLKGSDLTWFSPVNSISYLSPAHFSAPSIIIILLLSQSTILFIFLHNFIYSLLTHSPISSHNHPQSLSISPSLFIQSHFPYCYSLAALCYLSQICSDYYWRNGSHRRLKVVRLWPCQVLGRCVRRKTFQANLHLISNWLVQRS